MALINHAGEYMSPRTAILMGICPDCTAPIDYCDCDDVRPSRDSSRERLT